MKLTILACLIGFLALAPTAFGQDAPEINWDVFSSGTPEQVLAEIAKLPEDSGLETRDEVGRTPLMCAASNSNPEVITVLLKAGAEIEVRNNDRTPLMRAARFNSSPEVITALLEAGAELEARDKDGWTPLMFAARYNSSPEVITALLKAGANANAKDKEGKTALDYAKENDKIYKTKAYWELNDAFHSQG